MLTKVCGLTRAEDVETCEGLGIDLLGFIFHPPSPRSVAPEQVAGFPRGRALRVGVFVRQPPEEVLAIMDRSGLDLAQLHGGYSPAGCRHIGRDRVIKTFWPMGHSGPETFVQELMPFAASCRYLLLDSGTSGGGHGQATRAPWLPGMAFPCPWILAGGLGPDTIQPQLRELSPHGVDLNSGVESSPGIKDAGLIRRTLAMMGGRVEEG